MPVYEYLEAGKRVLRRVPVAQRDSFPGRVVVPSRISVCTRGEEPAGGALLNSWKECEAESGTESMRQLAKGMGLTREQVKQACLAPDSVMERPAGPGELVEA